MFFIYFVTFVFFVVRERMLQFTIAFQVTTVNIIDEIPV